MDIADDKPPEPEATGLPLAFAVDLQDHLMTATNDLERLQALLTDACQTLQSGFMDTSQELRELRADQGCHPGRLDGAIAQLGSAVTALQFQDLASQLIEHTRARLRNCADRLARDTFAADDDGEADITQAPLRPNPVNHADMVTGDIELF